MSKLNLVANGGMAVSSGVVAGIMYLRELAPGTLPASWNRPLGLVLAISIALAIGCAKTAASWKGSLAPAPVPPAPPPTPAP